MCWKTVMVSVSRRWITFACLESLNWHLVLLDKSAICLVLNGQKLDSSLHKLEWNEMITMMTMWLFWYNLATFCWGHHFFIPHTNLKHVTEVLFYICNDFVWFDLTQLMDFKDSSFKIYFYIRNSYLLLLFTFKMEKLKFFPIIIFIVIDSGLWTVNYIYVHSFFLHLLLLGKKKKSGLV